ncbi:MAG TPA: glucosamine-6-phosphate deaminase [Candidatus Hydrogenedentes bacterium]|nr:glucosamine-6-phosphate deaminase [Candidatus Hydrogenedentota bacterium]
MQVVLLPTRHHAVELTAQLIARQLRKKPNSVLGLATGRTMETLYARLAEMHREEGLDFSLAVTFNLDEYVGLPPQHPNSYRYYMNHHLFSRINIDLRNTHLPNGMALDPEAECAAYEAKIEDVGGIDLQLLSIGRSGHIGFNEPLSAMLSRTRVKALTPATIEQNAPLFPRPEDMPRLAITMGVGTILEAEECLVLVTGEEKADILAKAVEGPVTSMISATALQLHPRCTVIVDEAAGTRLTQKDYYRWIFENDPEWNEIRDLIPKR